MKIVKIDIEIITAEEAKENLLLPHPAYNLEEATTKALERIKTQIEQDSLWTNELYGKIPYSTERVDDMLEMVKAVVEHYGYNISIRKKEQYATYKITF